MTEKRPSPYLYATWLASYMAGGTMCEFSLWFRANFKSWNQPANNFDLAKWQLEHTARLREIVRKNRPNADLALVEDQGSFWVNELGVNISGKPDFVMVKGDSCIVMDAKTGKPKATDEVQLQLYMHYLPRQFPRLEGLSFSGILVYKDSPEKSVSPGGPTFQAAIDDALSVVLRSNPPEALPSERECGWCNISSEDCEDRID